MSNADHVALGAKLLFDPTTIAGLPLPNRIVMSPMTRHRAIDGLLIDSDYYEKRAHGGVGLIITEGVVIDHPVSDYMADCPRAATPQERAAWEKVATGVRACGARIVMQLWHTGIRRPVPASFHPELPSASPSGDYPGDWPYHYEPSSEQEIEAIIGAFARTAASAHATGFDGVEIHAAHGYLPDQFFWKDSNRRTDRFGGDIAGRTRFAVEVVRAIKRATAPDFPVFLRFSQWKVDHYGARLAETPQELEAFLEPLADAGVDMFDASTRRYWIPEFEGSDLNLAGWTKKITGRPTMTVGCVGLEEPLDNAARMYGGREKTVGVTGLDPLYERVGRGDFDLVGVGRALLSDPDWPQLVREGRFDRMTPYTADTVRRAVV